MTPAAVNRMLSKVTKVPPACADDVAVFFVQPATLVLPPLAATMALYAASTAASNAPGQLLGPDVQKRLDIAVENGAVTLPPRT